MSTKIYDAYKVTGTIHELMDLLKRIRKLHIEISINLYKTHSRTFKQKDFNGIIEKDETIETLCDNFAGEYILEKIIKFIKDKRLNDPLNVIFAGVSNC